MNRLERSGTIRSVGDASIKADVHPAVSVSVIVALAKDESRIITNPNSVRMARREWYIN